MSNPGPEPAPKKLLRPLNYVGNMAFLRDTGEFARGLVELLNRCRGGKFPFPIFIGDNLITLNKNLSFLRVPFFASLIKDEKVSIKEKGFIWRTYIVDYYARKCAKLPGDFVEAGCYQGYTASIIDQRVDFDELNKSYYLFDLFEWNEGDKHTKLAEHKQGLHEFVVNRFAGKPHVKIVKGYVPDSFDDALPERICFAHIDLNDAQPEVGAFKAIYPRLEKFGVIIFDDYGWWHLSDQKRELDQVAESFGEEILELPTGQGILVKYG